jgi:hypothetical protein
MRCSAALLVVMSGCSVAGAMEPQLAMNNLSHEYSTCAAYFQIVGVAMENSARADLAASYYNISEVAIGFAASSAETAGLLSETVTSRVEIAIRDMSERIDGNTSNISVLWTDYADLCEAAMERPAERIEYWLAR